MTYSTRPIRQATLFHSLLLSKLTSPDLTDFHFEDFRDVSGYTLQATLKVARSSILVDRYRFSATWTRSGYYLYTTFLESSIRHVLPLGRYDLPQDSRLPAVFFSFLLRGPN